jgi:Fe-S cluster assembly protein SufD
VTRLTDATTATDEPTWRAQQRAAALEVFRADGLPDPADEVWRYAPLEGFKLEDIDLAEPGELGALETAIGGRKPAAVVTIRAGRVVDVAIPESVDGLTITGGPGRQDLLGGLVGPDDAFAALNLALTPGPVSIEVAKGVRIDGTVVLIVDCPVGASFPRMLVHVGEGASLTVLEHITGADATLVSSVAEFYVGDGASLQLASMQTLGEDAWSVNRTRATIGRDASFHQTVAGLGAHYDRVRADALLIGDGASSALNTAHVGTGREVHDLRTMQDHVGKRTTSRLHSKAAVSGSAQSIYSGLIRMKHGAKRADARQVNNSLVLSDSASADAVPNLDIEENDVRCAHASTVGPVDPEQRWYLESRGVPPQDAVQLIIEGFFADVEELIADSILGSRLRDAIGELEAATGTIEVGP